MRGVLTDHQRLDRQAQIIHPDMARATIIIAGLGMLGSWTAHALVRAVSKVIVYDGGDVVEPENTGNQAYNAFDVEMPKGAALEQALTGLPLTAISSLFPNGDRAERVDIVVSCVDTLPGRATIARWCAANDVPLFIDTRALGEVAVICTARPEQINGYLDALPRERDVEQDRQCGATGGAYTGMWVASQVAATINNFYRGLRLPKMLVYHVGMGQEINRVLWKGGD